MSYAYRVTFVTDYLVITTTVELEADDSFQNLSSEAYEQAVINAENNVKDELGHFAVSIINDITVTLLLDDEEIELGNLEEFPPVHVEISL